MSRKRKNAGEGYGYMFHGAFKEKKDAVAKERKTPGAWVKGVFTKQGHRYVVMSPRTNPIKRKKKNPAGLLKYYAIAPAGDGTRRYKEIFVDTIAKTKTATGVFYAHKAAGRQAITSKNAHLVGRENPHELLIMGANPHPTGQQITVPPGSTITIRMNPTEVNPDRYTSKHAELSGARYHAPGLIQTGRQKRVAKMVRGARRHKYDWIPSEGIAPGQNPGDDSFVYKAIAELYPGKVLNELSTKELSAVLQRAAVLKHQPRQNITGLELAQIAGGVGGLVPLFHERKKRKNVELGTYENGVFHPWTRRPKSRQKKAIRRQNSSAAAIREDFTGAPAEFVTSADEPHMPAGDYAQLGELLALYVKPVKGGQVMQIDFRRPRPKIVSDESARQIWFFDGDQDVTGSLAQFGARTRGDGLLELGEARRIDYKQRKEHVPDPDVDEWRHEFGEETGVRPMVLFDRTKKRLLLEGGEYEIRREGIVN